MLGLIPDKFARIYHPVNRSGSSCSDGTGEMTNVTVDAAILALTHSFTVDNYECGNKLGTLTVRGAIAQKYRGPVGTGGTARHRLHEGLPVRPAPRPALAAPVHEPGAAGVGPGQPHGADPRLMTPMPILFAAFAGLLVGSFLNVVALRHAARRVLRLRLLALHDAARARSSRGTTSRCSPGCCCAVAAAAAAPASRPATRSWRPAPRRSPRSPSPSTTTTPRSSSSGSSSSRSSCRWRSSTSSTASSRTSSPGRPRSPRSPSASPWTPAESPSGSSPARPRAGSSSSPRSPHRAAWAWAT